MLPQVLLCRVLLLLPVSLALAGAKRRLAFDTIEDVTLVGVCITAHSSACTMQA